MIVASCVVAAAAAGGVAGTKVSARGAKACRQACLRHACFLRSPQCVQSMRPTRSHAGPLPHTQASLHSCHVARRAAASVSRSCFAFSLPSRLSAATAATLASSARRERFLSCSPRIVTEPPSDVSMRLALRLRMLLSGSFGSSSPGTAAGSRMNEPSSPCSGAQSVRERPSRVQVWSTYLPRASCRSCGLTPSRRARVAALAEARW